LARAAKTLLSLGAPDSVRWCTGQCPVCQAGVWSTGCSRVSMAAYGYKSPDSVRCANGSKSSTVGCARIGKNPHRTVSDGAPDCPVRQSTEGKNCLPGLLSTAPSCLGAIKGTPRRMEEYTKHPLSIPKHQDFISAHSILCDSK
jgi:hypothetical protein